MANVTINRPNFIASEVGIKLETLGVDAVTHSTYVVVEKDADGFSHQVIPAGVLIPTSGIIYQNIDVTGTTATTQKAAPIMTGGYFYTTRVGSIVSSAFTPYTSIASATLASLHARGLYERALPAETRPAAFSVSNS